MRKQPATENSLTRPVNLLSVSPAAEDHISLKHIVAAPEWANYTDSKWTLMSCSTLKKALAALREGNLPIVICDHDLPGGTWIELLEQTRTLPTPPYVIVASRMADDTLWAEALNLGAYDVLAKPFDAQEVVRIVSLAWLHWRERQAIEPAKSMRYVAVA